MTTIPGDLPQDANRTKSKKKPGKHGTVKSNDLKKSKKKRRKKRE